MSVLMEFSMFPTDKGEGVSQYVSEVIRMIRESGLNYRLTPMGTVIETDSMEEALEMLRKAHLLLDKESRRIYCSAKFDIRKGSSDRLEGKIASIEGKIGKVSH
ncbi:MAG: MTH1187 family thiamine-binding protein [Spirochaetota bacterium]|nr:MTH1187 family thiamine-binding protein [Spirochaetota bacterium]